LNNRSAQPLTNSTLPSAFEVISDYCQEHQKSACIRDLSFSIYRQQFESLIRDSETDPKTIEATHRTLLSSGSLAGHVRSAEELLRKQFEDDLKPLRRQQQRDSFWFAVITGIVGNIIYSLLLITLFIVAKDQLTSWLSSLLHSKQ